MNKKLLTLAIGAALTSAPMFANAAATVYGAAHLSIDSLDNGNALNNSVMTLSSNSSFLGFKAEEDLGGGLKAIYGAEWQIALDSASTNGASASTTCNVSAGTATTGTAIALITTQPTAACTDASGIANRNVFVGLTGGFGTVRLGNYDDITKQVGRAVDLFMNEQIGESRAATRQSRWDERLANSVNYESPDLGGAKITVNYGMANTVTDASQVTAMAAGVQYNAGPLYVGAAYKTVDLTSSTSASAIRATVSYKLMGDALRLVGFYQDVTSDTVADERSTMGLGVAYKIGNGTIKAQYYTVDDNNTANTGYELTSIGYDHSLSKTTTVYATYASMANGTAAAQTVIGAGHANPSDTTMGTIANGNDVTGISFGMKMAF